MNKGPAQGAPPSELADFLAEQAERLLGDRTLKRSIEKTTEKHSADHRRWLIEEAYNFDQTHPREWTEICALCGAGQPDRIATDDLRLRIGSIIGADTDRERIQKAMQAAIDAAAALERFASGFAAADVDNDLFEFFYSQFAGVLKWRPGNIETNMLIGLLGVLTETLRISAIALSWAGGGVPLKNPRSRPRLLLDVPVKSLMGLWEDITGKGVGFAKGTGPMHETEVDPSVRMPAPNSKPLPRYKQRGVDKASLEPVQDAAKFTFYALRMSDVRVTAPNVITSINRVRKTMNHSDLIEEYFQSLADRIAANRK